MPHTPPDLRARLAEGLVIPAHPLALDAERRLDERHQRALSRYYLSAGAGGLAVGVHTTQFEIHDPRIGLYRPVLELAREEAERFTAAGGPAPVLVAGIVGETPQALGEARLARELGYDCGLLSLGALGGATPEELLAHAAAVADVLPLFGFYLQPAVGGRELPYEFWRRFADIPRVVGIKLAPFDRYRTLDVVRAIADAGRLGEIALYTGNDDSIVVDLLTRFPFGGARIVGGLLGQWAVWTRAAVALLEQIRSVRTGDSIPAELLTRGAELTDANAALFDPTHRFAGCIPGIHEILRRQGLLRTPSRPPTTGRCGDRSAWSPWPARGSCSAACPARCRSSSKRRAFPQRGLLRSRSPAPSRRSR
jgi:dihydrodipicolinate synthase/N-acetylneuraminate lyase